MNSGEMMVVMIVAVVMIASIIKAVIAGPRHPVTFEGSDPKVKAETIRLHEELAQLKDRVKVLERIAIEKEDSLTKQIEELRDR